MEIILLIVRLYLLYLQTFRQEALIFLLDI